jgi:hypothetical protein
MLQYNPTVSGSLSVTGTITATQGITGSFSGSVAGFPTDVSAFSASLSTRITATELTSSEYVTTSGSLANRVSLTEATASQYVAASGSLSTRVTATEATASQFITASGSISTRLTTDGTSIASINAKTGSFATTGSNYFIGNQVITGSVYIANDLVVQGSSSLQNITASAVSIGTNTVILNTNTPILQFGGISVYDSGSTMGRSGSLLWNSINDHWINVNPSGSDEGYNSAMVINGPKNVGSLGNEAGLTTGYVPRSQGEDHIEDSNIYSSGSLVGINTNSPQSQFVVGGTANSASVEINLFNSGYGRIFAYNRSNSTSANLILNDPGGNVGIGYTNPSYQLQVLNTIGLRANSQNFQAIKGTGWGYSPGSYRVVMLGDSDPANFTTVSIGYDPSGNSNGAFSGNGKEVLFRNGASFATPTSANTAFHLNALVLKDGKIGINTDVPDYALDVVGAGRFSSILYASDNIRVYGAHQFWFGSTFRGQIVNYGAYAGTTDWSPFFTSETSLAFGVNGNATKALNIASTGAATFSSSVSANAIYSNTDFRTDGGTVKVGAGSNNYYTQMSTAYIFPYIDSYFDSVAGASYEGRIIFRTSSGGGALGTRMTILNNGNVGIGSTAPTSRLTVIAAAGAGALRVEGVTGQNAISLGGAGAFSIDYPGVAGGRFLVRDDGLVAFPRIQDFTTGNSPNTWINPASSYGIYINTSSIRYKRDVVDYDKGLDILNQIRPVYYKGTSEVDGDKQFAGFIAEEIDELGLTEFVNYLEDGRPNSLSYPNMLTIAVKAIQELKVENDTLKEILQRNNIQ